MSNRCCGVVCDQAGNAWRAAVTARSTSAAVATRELADDVGEVGRVDVGRALGRINRSSVDEIRKGCCHRIEFHPLHD